MHRPLRLAALFCLSALMGLGCRQSPPEEPPGTLAFEPLSTPFHLPVAHRFADGSLLVATGWPAPVHRLDPGATSWTALQEQRVRGGTHAGTGERLWVQARGEEGELHLGWLGPDGALYPVPPPMAEIRGQVAHPAGEIALTVWSAPTEGGVVVRQFDGARWKSLPSPPGRALWGGWGMADGGLVALGPDADDALGLWTWSQGAWSASPLPELLDAPTPFARVEVGASRALILTRDAAFTLGLEGTDPRAVEGAEAFLRSAAGALPSLAALADGRFLIVGGLDAGEGVDRTWILGADHRLRPGPRLRQGRGRAALAPLDAERALIIGGWGGEDRDWLASVELLPVPPASSGPPTGP